jgi:hypothetical protein
VLLPADRSSPGDGRVNAAIPPAIRELARRLDRETEVFQNHVLDFVRDVIEDRSFRRRVMARHRERFPATNPPRSHTSPSKIADLIAAELVHRRWWEQALERHPGTLRTLKSRLES